MKIEEFLKNTNLDNSLLIGYYGGGNFGDELLLEVLLHFLKKGNFKDVKVMYLSYVSFDNYHKRVEGIKVVDIRSKLNFIYEFVKSRNIVIGGGGIWGLDFNRNVFVLSLLIFFARSIFLKKVYLVGIGYYKSTTRIGNLAAFLVGKSSNLIIARDAETFNNFKNICRETYLDQDIAFLLPGLSRDDYTDDLLKLENKFNINSKTVFITIRRFQKKHQNKYQKLIKELIKKNNGLYFVLMLLEAGSVYEDGIVAMNEIRNECHNVFIADYEYNPVALYYFFKKHRDDLLIISPQFHGQLVAHLAGVKFLPVGYDNKNFELFKILNVKKYYNINQLTLQDLQSFVDNY
ncbi:polysaccharide pyruvyl transferase family protein [Candidatus Parcubacteria bacterium]|nr:polysaccharide pyruvyl transferase family protein [Patescibacteria group bacterium]MBU4308967.1 polysaccharide pyruvyl transferase family protein [Patescibacteria group bacterium]MBU4431863.1 polysaccharide pyruvyl transferase family protein [Patescibacteria group bacterium]MBU4577327.1 polysaccharide pyruvyl transferase family protein [Patescibacteria group bacterium]MCG2697015.1 polysaccharide pyruvyl transferase family protein [Candidatus Parcubacteria bacterium]